MMLSHWGEPLENFCYSQDYFRYTFKIFLTVSYMYTKISVIFTLPITFPPLTLFLSLPETLLPPPTLMSLCVHDPLSLIGVACMSIIIYWSVGITWITIPLKKKMPHPQQPLTANREGWGIMNPSHIQWWNVDRHNLVQVTKAAMISSHYSFFLQFIYVYVSTCIRRAMSGGAHL